MLVLNANNPLNNICYPLVFSQNGIASYRSTQQASPCFSLAGRISNSTPGYLTNDQSTCCFWITKTQAANHSIFILG
jgi:hypothetical protein